MESGISLNLQPQSSGNGVTAGWPVFLSAGILLIWIFGEVEWCLYHTSKFRLLSGLLMILAILFAVQSASTLRDRERTDQDSTKTSLVQTARAMYLMSLPLTIAAVLTARVLNSNYDFPTPLLRVAALLMKHLWR